MQLWRDQELQLKYKLIESLLKILFVDQESKLKQLLIELSLKQLSEDQEWKPKLRQKTHFVDQGYKQKYRPQGQEDITTHTFDHELILLFKQKQNIQITSKPFFKRIILNINECNFVNKVKISNYILNFYNQILYLEFQRIYLMIFVFIALFVIICKSQFGKDIYSISGCLKNCATCSFDEPEICIKNLGRMCIENYIWSEVEKKCIIDHIFRNESLLINSNGEFKSLQLWGEVKKEQCYYTNSKDEKKTIIVLGLFQSFGSNTLTVDVAEYYQSMNINFNFIRNVWAPFQDFLSIQVKDQMKNTLGKYIVQYFVREFEIEEEHTLTCQDQAFLIQKFQFNLDFRHKNISKVYIIFTGLLQGNELWGLTNFKVGFGCDNNLFSNGTSCLNCQEGFYLDMEHLVNKAPTCHQCTINCLSCTKQLCVKCATGMIAVGNHCQSSQGYKLIEKIYHPTQTHCNISMLHSIDESNVHKQVIQSIPISIPDYHSNVRLILDIYLTDTQWNNQSSLVLEVDGKLIKRIYEHDIHNRLRQQCADFALGFFSHFKIVTPYFQHNSSKMSFRVYSSDSSITDFGVGDISVQIQLSEPPKQEPAPQIKPIQPQKPIQPPKPTQQIKPPLIPIAEQKHVIQKINSIKQIIAFKNNVVISHNTLHENKKKGQLVISINYPFEVKNYPFIYCKFTGQDLYLPGKLISTTNHLQLIAVQITRSLINEIVVITMTAKQKILSKRNLQSQIITGNDQIQLGRILIQRYDVLDITQMSSLHSIEVFFVTITWIFLILTIILMMIGKGSTITDLSNLIQIIFLHIYINGQFLTPTFKLPISGLRNIENLNYFSYEAQIGIQSFLLGNVVQESPLRFQQFNTDINFSRGIYPIIIINLIFLIWFGFMKILNRLLKSRIKDIENKKLESGNICSEINQQPSRLQRLSYQISRIAERPFNFWYFVLKYQFLAVMWLCFLQFYNMSYPPGSDRNETINGIFCIAVFIATLCWPIGAYLLLRHFYNIKQYPDYLHQFEDIFTFQLYQRSYPSNHHRYYILLGKLRLIMYAICCSFLGNSPIQALVILILIHILSIAYLKVCRPILDLVYRRFYFAQYTLLSILEIVMIIAYAVEEIVTKQQYFGLGYLMVAISILLFINALARMIYKIYKLKTFKHEQKTTFKGSYATRRVV